VLDRGKRFWGGGLVILSEIYPAVLQEEETGGGFLGVEGNRQGGFLEKRGPGAEPLFFFHCLKNEVDAETSTD